MKRFTLVTWGVSLTLLAAMLGMYLGDVGVLVGSSQMQMVLKEGDLAVPYDGKARPGQSPPFTVTFCSYWEGFRVHKVLLHAPDRCATITA